MATDKKHIAVYLDPDIERALVAFCESKGLISKKGTMFSAGVNAALAEFFGISGKEESNTHTQKGNIPIDRPSDIPVAASDTPLANRDGNISGNIPPESVAVEVLPGKLRA